MAGVKIVVYEPKPSPALIAQRLQRQQQRQAAKREGRQQAAAAAEHKLQAIKANSSKRVCSAEKHGEVQLPPAMLQRVMSCLADIEAGGVRGPSLASRDLANASLVSWDFYNASKHGFATLVQQASRLTLNRNPSVNKPASVHCTEKALLQLPHLPVAGGWSWQQWAAFLQDPLQRQVPELKQAARQLKVACKTTKAVLLVNILHAFGLQQPSSVAPQLLRAVLLERCCPEPWDGCDVVNQPWLVLRLLGRDEVDQQWPGLWELTSRYHAYGYPAAEQRRALHTHMGARSEQQLLQLRLDAHQQWNERLQRRLTGYGVDWPPAALPQQGSSR